MDEYILDEKKEQALEELRTSVGDLLQPHHDDYFLLRFLAARSFDPNNAEKMLREDFKFRKKMHSDTIANHFMIPEHLLPFQMQAFLGYDNEGRAVTFLNVGSLDAKGFVRACTMTDIIKGFILQLENIAEKHREQSKKLGKNIRKGTFIADFSGIRLGQWIDRSVLRTAIQITKFYQDHYPETLHVVYSLNMPSMLVYLYNKFLLSFVDPIVQKKLRLYATNDDSWKEELFALVPKDILPAYIGGERCEPPGDPKCHALLNWYERIPPSLYLKDTLNLKTSDPEVKQKLIRERSYFEVEKHVGEDNMLLSWEFQTKNHDIVFGLFYKKMRTKSNSITNLIQKLKKDETEVLLALEKVYCDTIVESGEYVCSRPGIYILHFDNTYSWLRPKHLLYKIKDEKIKEETVQ